MDSKDLQATACDSRLQQPVCDPVEPAAVHRLVLALNGLCKAATLQFALSVGQLVIRDLYSDDLGKFRTRDRKHELALRKVAAHTDLAMSPSMLYSCIAIYELCQRLRIESWQHVSTSHIRRVLPLEPDAQAHLLRSAETGRWPVKRLEEEIIALQTRGSSLPARGGRRRSSRLRKWIHDFEKSLESLPNLLQPKDADAQPSPESVRNATELLRRASAMFAVIENHAPPDEQS